MTAVFSNRNLPDIIAGHIIELVDESRLLYEADLRAELNVSCVLPHEAHQTLQAQGFAKSSLNRGSCVLGTRSSNIATTADLSFSTELTALRRVFSNAAELLVLSGQLESMQQHDAAHGDRG